MACFEDNYDVNCGFDLGKVQIEEIIFGSYLLRGKTLKVSKKYERFCKIGALLSAIFFIISSFFALILEPFAHFIGDSGHKNLEHVILFLTLFCWILSGISLGACTICCFILIIISIFFS
jgi:hypothetical protein